MLNPYLSGQLARDRYREALASAGQLRLVDQLRAASDETSPAGRLRHRVRSQVLATAARLRPASPASRAAVLTEGVRDA